MCDIATAAYVTEVQARPAEPPPPVLLYALFGVVGVASVLLGVLLPRLEQPGVGGDAHGGALLAMQFTGQWLGSLTVGRRVRPALLVGLLASVAAAAWLAATTLFLPAVLLVYGLGLGTVMTATNIMAGLEASGARRASRLEALNMFWPAGAAVCPWVAVALRGRGDPLLPFAAVAAALGVLLLLLWRRPNHPAAAADPEKTPGSAGRSRLIFCCVLALLAVGVESAAGGWLAVFAARYLGDVRAVAWVPSLFWCGLLLGRLVASRVVLAVRPAVFGAVSAAGAAAMILALAVGQGAWVVCGAAFLAAFAVAPLYPVALAGSVDLRAKNLVFFTAGVGSVLVPWLLGRASVWSGSLREAMGVPVLAALALSVVFVASGRAAGRRRLAADAVGPTR